MGPGMSENRLTAWFTAGATALYRCGDVDVFLDDDVDRRRGLEILEENITCYVLFKVIASEQ